MAESRSDGAGTTNGSDEETVRYAVVGLGWFAQVAVLPAFEHTGERSELVALVSGDDEKLRKLGDRFDIDEELRVGYDGYRQLLASGEVDAVYIVSPNHMHREHAVTAAEEGVHVLTEKPMAVTVAECDAMIEAARAHEVRLMVAYRLHFAPANLEAARIVREGRLGTPRYLDMVFSNPVENEDDIRLGPIERGGGSVYDVGVYCINAGRYLFGAEPTEVAAFTVRGTDSRFTEADEMTSVVLRYPDDRLATFTSSLGAFDRASARVVGTEGELLLEPAFHFKQALRHRLTVGDETTEREFPKRDQVAPEIDHFTECILEDREPEPSGAEGRADVRIVQAIYRSAGEGGRPVRLGEHETPVLPDPSQEASRPAPGEQELVDEEGP